MAILLPQPRFSVIVLCNLATASPETLARKIADLYLAADFKPAKNILNAVADLPDPAAFAGTYLDPHTKTLYTFTADHGNLKTIIYGGGPMYVADLKRALALVGPRLSQIYGQGEAPMTITGLPQEMHQASMMERLSSCGFARTGCEVRIFDHADGELPPGEMGEIVTRSDCIMAGYWQSPEATQKTLRGGWLHTGDVGSMDAAGFLTIRDRSKDMIISGGSNIYPREIEEVLLRHPAVAECSVVGRPHAEWGEEVIAFVVTRTKVATEDLDKLCLDNIARFKRPREYRFVEALPKNNYGKVLKTELRKLLAPLTP